MLNFTQKTQFFNEQTIFFLYEKAGTNPDGQEIKSVKIPVNF
jgi:hypothetical protein